LSIASQQYEVVNNAHERALVHLHKMPRIWLDYLEFLMKQKKGTLLRRTFDRALQSLPITQHKRIWKLYLKWVKEFGVWETAVRVYRRYLKFNPDGREEYVNYLTELGHFEEVSVQPHTNHKKTNHRVHFLNFIKYFLLALTPSNLFVSCRSTCRPVSSSLSLQTMTTLCHRKGRQRTNCGWNCVKWCQHILSKCQPH